MDVAKIQAEVRAELEALADRTAKRVLGELLSEYNVEAARVVDALVPDTSETSTRRGHRVRSVTRAYRTKPLPQGKRYNIEAVDVLNAVRLLGEASIAQIRAHAFPKASIAAVRRRLKELAAEGKIKVTGEKRQTRYKIAAGRGRAR